MRRRVEHDGSGALRVRFSFDRGLVDRIKGLPNRRWVSSERYWSVPDTDVVLLVEVLDGNDFRFDEVTRELYRRMGGRGDLATFRPGDTTETDGAAPEPWQPRRTSAPVGAARRPRSSPSAAAPPALPLFDLPGPPPPPPAADDFDGFPPPEEQAPTGGTTDLTVSGLNQQVRQVIESAFPTSVWIVGEISGFNKSAHRRHVGFQFVELDDDGRKVSEVSATLFEETRLEVERALERAGDPFRLEDELTVRARVLVELYVPWGSYRVIVEEFDLRYTLGEAARRREEAIRRLTEEGLAERNPAIPLPEVPLRVGLITSLGSDAYNDVLRSLEESGYAFEVTAHGARVQGRQTEPSVLNALDWFRRRQDRFDVVLICRGGGSRTDLAWFDSYELGRAVAGFPLPVIVGIGHEQDHCVLDAIARRAKTPTAAAGQLVEAVLRTETRIEEGGRGILEAAGAELERQRRKGDERTRRLVVASRHRIGEEQTRLGHLRSRAVLAARGTIAAARSRLARWSESIPRASALQVERGRGRVENSAEALLRSFARRTSRAAELLALQAGRLAPAARRVARRESERLDQRNQRLRLVDPRRVIERGYCILRNADGRVITTTEDAPRGSALDAELRRGSLRLRSEGAIPGSVGEARQSSEENEA